MLIPAVSRHRRKVAPVFGPGQSQSWQGFGDSSVDDGSEGATNDDDDDDDDVPVVWDEEEDEEWWADDF